MCVCVCALISVKYYITIFDSAPGKVEMPYKTENQLNSIRSVNGFQCLLSALHKCWHPVGLLRFRMNATVSCRMGSAWSFVCCTELIIFGKVASVRLTKTNYFFFLFFFFYRTLHIPCRTKSVVLRSLSKIELILISYSDEEGNQSSVLLYYSSINLPLQSCQLSYPVLNQQMTSHKTLVCD